MSLTQAFPQHLKLLHHQPRAGMVSGCLCSPTTAPHFLCTAFSMLQNQHLPRTKFFTQMSPWLKDLTCASYFIYLFRDRITLCSSQYCLCFGVRYPLDPQSCAQGGDNHSSVPLGWRNPKLRKGLLRHGHPARKY